MVTDVLPAGDLTSRRALTGAIRPKRGSGPHVVVITVPSGRVSTVVPLPLASWLDLVPSGWVTVLTHPRPARSKA